MLAHLAEDIAPVGLQFGQPRLHHVGLLGALEVFAAAANPLLGFQQQGGELAPISCVRNLISATRSSRSSSIFFSYLARVSDACSSSSSLALPGAGLRALGRRRAAPVCDRVGEVGDLANQLEQVGAGLLGPLRAQVDVVVDIVHAHGERAERQFRRVGSSGSTRARLPDERRC